MTPFELETQLAELVAPHVGVPADEIDPDAYLDDLGLSSRDAVVLAGELEDLLDKPVAPTIAWEAPTVRLLATILLPTAADVGRPASLQLVPDALDQHDQHDRTSAGVEEGEIVLPPGVSIADGAVQVWTSNLVDLPGRTAPLSMHAAAALARAAARASGVDGPLAVIGLDPAPHDGDALLSCSRTGDGAEIELLHQVEASGASSWARSLYACVGAVPPSGEPPATP